MIPEMLAEYALGLVYLSGAAELAGALGLVVPLSVYRRLDLPNLRKWAGVGLSVMLALLVVADVNVAMEGSSVRGLEFGSWYYWLQPFVQPLFVVWALYVSGVIWEGGPERDERLTDLPGSSSGSPPG
jgi:uncharacterized membrane protein